MSTEYITYITNLTDNIIKAHKLDQVLMKYQEKNDFIRYTRTAIETRELVKMKGPKFGEIVFAIQSSSLTHTDVYREAKFQGDPSLFLVSLTSLFLAEVIWNRLANSAK